MRFKWQALSLAAALIIVLGIPGKSHAWGVMTESTDSCHEDFAGRAFRTVVLDLPGAPDIQYPDNDDWRTFSDVLLSAQDIDPTAVDDCQRFGLVSMMLGVRYPDTDGHSLLDLQSLRNVHADPGAEGQYLHALRGPDDDFQQGDATAVAGTRQTILNLMELVKTSFYDNVSNQNTEAAVYLDFYGLMNVTVWKPMFYAGMASHVLQDSFSHTIRTEQDGFRTIATVMNYIDAISSDYNEQRDGLAHSDSFDECSNPEMAPIVKAVDQAMVEFTLAANAYVWNEDPDAVEKFLDEWLTHDPSCNAQNDYCENGHWVAIAREEQTGPYMDAILGCTTIGPSSSCGSWFVWAALGWLFVRLSRTSCRRRR